MRLWTLHPAQLDAKGLVALWREGLLARAVLRGKTKGYRHHPQLDRFRACARPLAAIDAYLAAVLDEARRRGYRFDARKIDAGAKVRRLAATRGQLELEWERLGRKLRTRAPEDYRRWLAVKPRAHPLFALRAGGVAPWERAPLRAAARRAASPRGRARRRRPASRRRAG